MNQLEMFGQNIYLLIGILLFLVLLLVVLVLSWAGVRITIFGWRQRQSLRDQRTARFHRDGTRMPPQGEGICVRCGRAGFDVYCLPGNQRLCEACYRAARDSAAAVLHPTGDSSAPAGRV